MAGHIIVMGVAGCGKSTIGRLLAQRLGRHFIEGDDYHLPTSVEKMTRGVPLSDQDRLPWLRRLRGILREHEEPVVMVCSALRQRYRNILEMDSTTFVFLSVSRSVARARVASRDHFFPLDLVDSQFESLEEPQGPGVIRVDAEQGTAVIINELVYGLTDHP